MSRRRRIQVESEPADGAAKDRPEGWESLAEEENGGVLPPNAELEEALREAAEAVDDSGRKLERAPVAAQGSMAGEVAGGASGLQAGQPSGEGAGEDPAQELKHTQGRLLRLQADFENFRRRATRERLEASQYGHQNLVKDLLSTVDNLERAIGHARQSGGGDLENLLQGVELVHRELLTALGKHGVVRLEAVGKVFDPALHEALAQKPDASVPVNTVVEELQTGYQLRDRLLRPSRVVVAKVPDEPAGRAESEASGD